MLWSQRLSHFADIDFFAIAFLVLAWLGVGYIIENPPKNRPSLSRIMIRYRREWMVNFVDRNPRVFDAQMLSTLRQGTAFFASTTMIAIGGGLALLGNPEQIASVTNEFAMMRAPTFVLEVKLLVMILFVANAFLKFVWSHRLFGYCSVVMSAVPNDPNDAAAMPRAMKASELNSTAARSYNRGLRSVYFALAAAAWLFGAMALIAATAMTVFVLWRREFASNSRAVMLAPTDAFND